MKNKLFLSFLALIITFAVFATGINIKSVYADLQENGYTTISALSDIVDPSGNYILSQNVELKDFNGIEGTFKGTLNGNGHTISGTTFAPIFEKIGIGAKVFNLRVDGITLSIKNDTTNSTLLNYGVLAGEISGANIEQVNVKNSTIQMFKQQDVGQQNAGEEPANEEPQLISDTILTNANVGMLAGKVCDGSFIINCVIENSLLNVKIADTTSQNYNFGGIAGYVANATIANNIINLYDVSGKKAFIIELVADKTINIGTVAGFSDFKSLFVYNNVALIDSNNIEVDVKSTTKNIGALIGVLNSEVNQANIQGFVTTFGGEVFGKRQTATQNYQLITKTTYASMSFAMFLNQELWYDVEYNWDFSKTWKQEANSKLPILQCFVKYAVSFDSEESLKSLNLEVMPTVQGGDYSAVIPGKVSKDQVFDENDSSSISTVEYGSSIYIKAQIAELNKYNNFFKIEGLQLNSKTIYQNQIGVCEDGFDITVSEQDGAYIYEIKNFTAKCEGTYNVLLGRNTFKIKVKVFDLGTQNTGSIMPGKFKTNSETNPMQEKIIDMEYGERFILNTSVTNTDYSDRADWYIFDLSEKDAFQNPVSFNPFDTSSKYYENSNFYYINKIEWMFTETSEIFRPADADYTNTKTYFDMANYIEADDESGNLTSNYIIYIVYNTRVKNVKIVLRDDKGNQINGKVANLLIDNKSDLLTWNEEENVYYAKVAFTKDAETKYRIQVDGLDTKYQFSGWWFDIGQLTSVEGNSLAGEFGITEDTNDLVIYLELIEDNTLIGNNMLWLYITLGVVGLGLAILVIVIIIKKRKGGGGSSYKKYYY